MRDVVILIGVVAIAGCVMPHRLPLRGGDEGQPATLRSGLYITAADFESGRLADAIACQTDSRPVEPDAFSTGAQVQWPAGTASKRYPKAEIFGFRACDGTNVRFVRGANFRVVRAPPLYLYQHEYRVSAGKGGFRLLAEYGFSTTAADSVRPLTLDALKRAYPENHRFHDLLDLAFRSDEELMRYDEFHHEYRVARLLRGTLEQAGPPTF